MVRSGGERSAVERKRTWTAWRRKRGMLLARDWVRAMRV